MAAPVKEWVEKDESLDPEGIAAKVVEQARADYEAKFAPIEKDVLHQYERSVMLQSIDTHWREHLAALDYLRQGIHLRGYAQKQPKQEYKREAFELFGTMLDSIKRQVTQHLMAVQIRSQAEVEEAERRAEEAAQAVRNVQYHHADPDEALAQARRGRGRAARASGQPFVRPARRSAATTPAPAARAGSTRTATASSPDRLDAAGAPSSRAWTSPCAAPSPATSRALANFSDESAYSGTLQLPTLARGLAQAPRDRRGHYSSWPARARRSSATRPAPGPVAAARHAMAWAWPCLALAGRGSARRSSPRSRLADGWLNVSGSSSPSSPTTSAPSPLPQVRLRDRGHPPGLRAARRPLRRHAGDGAPAAQGPEPAAAPGAVR